MIVIKVISLLLLISTIMSPVLNQTQVTDESDGTDDDGEYGEYDQESTKPDRTDQPMTESQTQPSTQRPTQTTSESSVQPSIQEPTQPPTKPPDDCTDVNNPITKEEYNKKCKISFCDCLNPLKGCPPQWSRSFADGLANKKNFEADTWCAINNRWIRNIINFDSSANLLQIKYAPWKWEDIYFYQMYDLDNVKAGSAGEVRYPDTHHLRDVYLNTSYYGPDIKAKGFWYLTYIVFSPKLLDNKDVTKVREGLYYPSYYQMSVPSDPLFDSYIIGPMHKYYRVWYQIEKYIDYKHSNKLEFQALSFENNFDSKFNSKTKTTKLLREMAYCLGSKYDAQTDRLYWTAEGCRSVTVFASYPSKTDLGYDHNFKCECNFESVGYTKPTPTTTPSLQLVEGFNLPEGIRQPIKSVNPDQTARWTTIFGIIILSFNVLLIVFAIGIGFYFLF